MIFVVPLVMFQWILSIGLFWGGTQAYIRCLLLVVDHFGFLAAGGFLPLGLFGMSVAQTLFGLVWKRILLGRAWPGTYPIYGSYYMRRWMVWQITLQNTAIQYIQSTSFSGWYYNIQLFFSREYFLLRVIRLWGATVEGDSELNSMFSLCDCDLVRIGEGCFVGGSVQFLCSQIMYGFLNCESVELGAYTFVGNNSCISGGAQVGEATLVGCSTMVDMDTFDPGLTLIGSPCISIPIHSPTEAADDQGGANIRAIVDVVIILVQYPFFAFTFAFSLI